MKLGKRILISAGCILLLVVSWLVAVQTPSASERQAELLEEASALMADKIYIRAEPILEEAINCGGEHTLQAESMLKELYLCMMERSGYARKYIALLETQMARQDAEAAVFQEAASFYLERAKVKETLEILRNGIARTGDQGLVELYENNRYGYTLGRTVYDDVTAIHDGKIAVQLEGLWGLAKADGTQMIPCEYEKISTFSVDRAIVRKNGEIYAVDQANNRLALMKESATDFGNLADGRVPLLIGTQWHRCGTEFEVGTAGFEELGTYSGGYIAAKQGGKWGVIDQRSEWLIEPKHEGIITDELGRCYGQGAVFVRNGDAVQLFVNGTQQEGTYEDARPFSETGYAAVKKNGMWGFIDTAGIVRIDFQFEDALSFGQHLAAVRKDGKWGYISLLGKMVIEPTFLQAKSFGGGSAPVLTERGWAFITLLEYKEEAGL